jgi:hypothetical protein
MIPCCRTHLGQMDLDSIALNDKVVTAQFVNDGTFELLTHLFFDALSNLRESPTIEIIILHHAQSLIFLGRLLFGGLGRFYLGR